MATVFKSTYCTTTLLGMINQLQGVSELEYDPHINTTINKKRSVYPGYNNGRPEEIPTLKYFGMGINGYFNTNDGNVTQPYYPLATDMDIYQPIPFRVRLLAEDLIADGTNADRNQYRMRTVENIGGYDYAVYWLKMIEYPNPNLIKITNVAPDGTESDYDLSETDSNGLHPKLNPVASEYTVPVVDPGTTATINISMEGTCTMLGEEVLEAINVMYGGNLLKAKISEVGLYTGCEFTPTPGAPASTDYPDYKEAMYTQLAGHRCTNGTDMSQQDSVKIEKISFKNGNIVAGVPV